MSAATILGATLPHLYLVFFPVAFFVWWRTMRRARLEHRALSSSFVLWGELLFWYAGFGLLIVGITHAYFHGTYDLGWAEIALAFAALFARQQHYGYRLAITIPLVIWSFAVAIGHVTHVVEMHSFTTKHAGLLLWFNDIVFPLVLVWTAYASRDEAR